jgi:hypothetical protein
VTIEHLVACDACGTSRALKRDELDSTTFCAPDEWVALLPPDDQTKHFCSWVCVGSYVTQKMREEELQTRPVPQES